MFSPRYTRQALKSGACALFVALSACDPSPPDYAPPAAPVDADTVSSGNVSTQGSGGRSQDPAEHESPVSVGGGLHGSEAGGAPSVTSAGRVASNSAAGIAGFSTRSGVSSAGAGGISGARNATTASSGNASTCAGKKPGALRGKSNQTISVGGVSRTFVQYVPPDLEPNQSTPVVFVPHGWLMSGEQMYTITNYHLIADREHFVVFYPDGQPASLGPWNVGEGACPSNLVLLPTATGNDQAFLDAMLEFIESDRCIDRKHVFMSGFSMGGYFSNETGCLRSEIAAVGPHSGGSHELSNCTSRRKPVILFHGDADGLIPASCGKEARDRWVALNGCSQITENHPVRRGHCEFSVGCPVDGQVVLCLFEGMDHGWAGGANATFSFPDYESAAELGWSFFKTYAW
ncbi:MAG TPA: PHB depolymerase family esterase [Polyangiaceae bacterium]|nr:PHB depolymerase family esterase [Polyangiaceae bacterium]